MCGAFVSSFTAPVYYEAFLLQGCGVGRFFSISTPTPDSDSSSFKKPTPDSSSFEKPTPDSSSFEKPTPTPAENIDSTDSDSSDSDSTLLLFSVTRIECLRMLHPFLSAAQTCDAPLQLKNCIHYLVYLLLHLKVFTENVLVRLFIRAAA